MPNSKDKLDSIDGIVAVTTVVKTETGYTVDAKIRSDFAEYLGDAKEQVVESLREKALMCAVSGESENRQSTSGRPSVGYSKSYAANWDAVFGKKNEDGELN